MKRLTITLLGVVLALSAWSQGWPANFKGVMLQGFYWDSYVDSQWSNLEKQSDELSKYFALIWIPQSGDCNSSWNQMGYSPVYWFTHNSSFGSEAELRSLIKTFRAKGVGIIEDVVINHRNNLGVDGSWVDFPAETYNGVKYQLKSTDICADDDGGKTKTWATSNGYSVSSNNDTGEGWDGNRDLDHMSSNVQSNVKAYLKFLLSDLGYVGFRYDMTKGYSANFTGMYNAFAVPTYSVGEYWEGNAGSLKNWVEGTRYNGAIQSAAFDFPLRYSIRDAVNPYNGVNYWNNLGNGGLFNLNNSAYNRYSVTFVENHDTQVRSATDQQDPIRSNIAAANAYILALPGTPCVFLRHWIDYKDEIKQMILARNLAGITNQSSSSNMRSTQQYYAQRTIGDRSSIIVVMGNQTTYVPSSSQYVKILSGTNYSYYMEKKAEAPWVDKADGTYEKAFDATLTAISATTGASLVYTTDGSTPTASSAKVASGGKVNISKSCTLKVGLLVSGAVKDVISREYVIKPFVAHTATVYLKDPGWSDVYFYTWDNTASNKQLNGNWPGEKVTQTTTIKGQKFYYFTYDISTSGYSFNVIFDQGSGKDQTVDIGPVSEDVYYEIASKNSQGKYQITNITDQYGSGINDVVIDTTEDNGPATVYTIDGRLVRVAQNAEDAKTGLEPGLYIINRKKVIVK